MQQQNHEIIYYLQYEIDKHFPGEYSSTWMWSSKRSLHRRSVWEYSTCTQKNS